MPVNRFAQERVLAQRMCTSAPGGMREVGYGRSRVRE